MKSEIIIKALKFLIVLVCIALLSCNYRDETKFKDKRIIITSDTLLSSIVSSVLPSNRYTVESILPHMQCPGHYDFKLKDIEKINRADLIVSFKDMPFLQGNAFKNKMTLTVDSKGHNWMAPIYYEYGLRTLAESLSRHFHEDAQLIEKLKNYEIEKLKDRVHRLKKITESYNLVEKKVIASSMQREFLEWMGFTVVASYGRKESLSAKDMVELIKRGKKEGVVLIVDNLQSGPDAGKSIAEALSIPHVVLTNFPSEKGYLNTLDENIFTLLKALGKK